MKQVILFSLAFLPTLFAYAQTDSLSAKKKIKVFHVRIETLTGEKVSGEIAAFDTNGLYVIKTPAKHKSKMEVPANTYPGSFSYNQIQTVTIRRKNSALKGALIGFGIGAATGVIIGFASGSDPVQPYYPIDQDPLFLGNLAVAINNSFAMTASQKAVAGGIGVGALGAIAGAVIGAVAKKKFIIGGKKENSRNLQAEMLKKLVIKK